MHRPWRWPDSHHDLTYVLPVLREISWHDIPWMGLPRIWESAALQVIREHPLLDGQRGTLCGYFILNAVI